MNIKRWFIMSALLATLALQTGCWGVWGYKTGKPGHTTQYRFEGEFVPNAVLVREDIKPNEKGRLAFERGQENLLVITRITSSAVDLEDPKGPREDRYWERVWITIPMDTPMGAEIDLAELEEYFVLGYDKRANATGPDYSIFPCRVTGKVTLVQRREHDAIVKIDARVAPREWDDWPIQETLTVPLTETGIHARMADSPDVYRFNVFSRLPPTLTPFEREMAGNSQATENSNGAMSPVGVEQPVQGNSLEGVDTGVNAQTQTDGEEGPQTDENRPIVGKWFMTSGEWEHRWQFYPDNTFLFTATRGVAPMVMKGRYQIREDRENLVILDYKEYYEIKEGGYQHDHMKFIANRLMSMKIKWQNDDLVLDGPAVQVKTPPPYHFRSAQFPDFRHNTPPTVKTGG